VLFPFSYPALIAAYLIALDRFLFPFFLSQHRAIMSALHLHVLSFLFILGARGWMGGTLSHDHEHESHFPFRLRRSCCCFPLSSLLRLRYLDGERSFRIAKIRRTPARVAVVGFACERRVGRLCFCGYEGIVWGDACV
jgi:hypothetical protein